MNKIDKLTNKIKREGFSHAVRDLGKRFLGGDCDYATSISEADIEKMRSHVFDKNPLISIVTPLFNTDEVFLRSMIESVLTQIYPNFELCLIDYSDSALSRTETVVSEYMEKDKRIRYKKGVNRGIAENTNECIEMSEGEFVAILDHDDMLHPAALYEAVAAINEGADFVYTDEVKFRSNSIIRYSGKDYRFLGRLERPNFKPDFTEAELTLHNYICHFNVYSRKLYDAAGPYDKSYDGSQDHEMVLRLSSKASHIVHIRKILYFWRIHEASVSSGIGAKPYATLSAIKGVDRYLNNKAVPLEIESIHDNVPIYKFKKSQVDGSITTLIWGSKSKEKQESLGSRLNKAMGRETEIVCYQTGKLDEGLDVYITGCNTDFLLLVSDKVHLNEAPELKKNENDRLDINELLYYSAFKDIKGADARLICRNELLSAGISLVDGKINYRSTGLPKNYQGYEADYHHARAVAGISGIFSVLYLKNVREGADKYFWTPFVEAELGMDDFNKLKEADYIKNDILILPGKDDPYHNQEVERYKLD